LPKTTPTTPSAAASPSATQTSRTNDHPELLSALRMMRMLVATLHLYFCWSDGEVLPVDGSAEHQQQSPSKWADQRAVMESCFEMRAKLDEAVKRGRYDHECELEEHFSSLHSNPLAEAGAAEMMHALCRSGAEEPPHAPHEHLSPGIALHRAFASHSSPSGAHGTPNNSSTAAPASAWLTNRWQSPDHRNGHVSRAPPDPGVAAAMSLSLPGEGVRAAPREAQHHQHRDTVTPGRLNKAVIALTRSAEVTGHSSVAPFVDHALPKSNRPCPQTSMMLGSQSSSTDSAKDSLYGPIPGIAAAALSSLQHDSPAAQPSVPRSSSPATNSPRMDATSHLDQKTPTRERRVSTLECHTIQESHF